MKISLDNGATGYRITAYEPGSIKINSEIIQSAVIISARRCRTSEARTVETLTEALLISALEEKPDILLLGTGKKQRFPEPRLIKPIAEAGAGLEIMDTAAACRTYNVLVSEDRQVMAALLVCD